MNYEEKYLKYKKKYLSLKNTMYGGDQMPFFYNKNLESVNAFKASKSITKKKIIEICKQCPNCKGCNIVKQATSITENVSFRCDQCGNTRSSDMKISFNCTKCRKKLEAPQLVEKKECGQFYSKEACESQVKSYEVIKQLNEISRIRRGSAIMQKLNSGSDLYDALTTSLNHNDIKKLINNNVISLDDLTKNKYSFKNMDNLKKSVGELLAEKSQLPEQLPDTRTCRFNMNRKCENLPDDKQVSATLMN